MLYMHLICVAQQAGSCSIRDQCAYICIAAMRWQVLVGRWNLFILKYSSYTVQVLISAECEEKPIV